jgi:hypothetical protein
MYLWVLPMKGVRRFGMKGKLAPRYIGLFPIHEKCGSVAYKLDLPPILARDHDILHMSQLKKCLKAPVDVVLPDVTPLKAKLTYPKHPIKILDVKCNGVIIVKRRQCGKARTSYVRTIRTLSYRTKGTCDCSLSLLGLFSQISG